MYQNLTLKNLLTCAKFSTYCPFVPEIFLHQIFTHENFQWENILKPWHVHMCVYAKLCLLHIRKLWVLKRFHGHVRLQKLRARKILRVNIQYIFVGSLILQKLFTDKKFSLQKPAILYSQIYYTQGVCILYLLSTLNTELIQGLLSNIACSIALSLQVCMCMFEFTYHDTFWSHFNQWGGYFLVRVHLRRV